jgi:cell division protein FtsA
VVKKKLGASFVPDRISAGVVITGGTAKLPNVAEAAAKVFGVVARVGELPGYINENLRDPAYATGLGLLYFGLNSNAEAAVPVRRRSNFFTKLFASV